MYKESEYIELKKSLSQLKEGVISLCAMLNKNGKGAVYFGINDDGKIFGMDVGKRTKSEIGHEIQNHLKPFPTTIKIDDLIQEDKTIIKVEVEGNDTPYSAYGRFYVRLDDSDILMQPHELQYFFEQKEDNYLSWEQKETNFGVDDIDEELLIDCIRTANEKGRLNYIYRNPFEALTKLGLLTENGHLNNAGYYLFGKSCPFTIKEAIYPTDSRTEFGEIKEFTGNIIQCIKEAVSYLQNHILYKSIIVGPQREEVPEIPLKAIREIVINSFAHRSYAKKGDFNTYIIYKSSVHIYNPGSIYKSIDPMKFASGKVGSKIRNILISKVLFNYGYIDSFGTGFDRTFSLCAASNVEYKYNNDEFGFTFIFKRDPNFLSNNKIDTNKDLLKIDELIIEAIKDNKYITIPELSELIGRSSSTIHRHIEKLSSFSYIKRVGSRKTGYWIINL